MTEERKALYEFYVAGVQHHKLHTCIKEMKEGDSLILVTEPTNRFDPNAVRIEFNSLDKGEQVMLGYVPKAKGDYSSKVSALMILRPIRCEVLELKPEAKTWEQLKVGIFDVENKPGEVSER